MRLADVLKRVMPYAHTVETVNSIIRAEPDEAVLILVNGVDKQARQAVGAYNIAKDIALHPHGQQSAQKERYD